MYLILVIVCAVGVKNGLGQNYNYHHHQNRYLMGGQHSASPVTSKQYRDYPFSPFSGSGGLSQNGRFEVAKAANFPPQYYDNHGSQSISSAALTSSSVPLQPSSFYSGYYYMQDKPSRGPHPQSSHLSSPYISNLFSQMPADSTHSSLSAMTPAHLHSVVLHPPPAPPPLHPQSAPLVSGPSASLAFTRLPGFPISSPSRPASLDTYKEALDLFSEVVYKLEKEPRGNSPQPTSNPMLSNAVYGPGGRPPPGFPRQLDHIMGADFLNRAQKLYTKIIKEQNERLGASSAQSQPQFSPSPIIPNQKYSMYHNHPGSRNSIHHGYEHGPPQYESLLHSNQGSTYQPYTRPSYLARNMNLDPFVNYPQIEAVKSIEIPMGRRDDRDSDEMMQTSESIHRPINYNQISVPLPLVSAPHPFYRQPIQTQPISTAPPPQPPQTTPEEIPTSPVNDYDEERASIPLSALDLPRSTPISENDYAEHPLPYDEYEGLVRDIAMNHNY